MQSADKQRGTEVGNRPVGVPPVIRHGQDGHATNRGTGISDPRSPRDPSESRIRTCPCWRHCQGGRATKAPDGLKTQKDVKNRGNELKDLLEINDLELIRRQKRTQNELIFVCKNTLIGSQERVFGDGFQMSGVYMLIEPRSRGNR